MENGKLTRNLRCNGYVMRGDLEQQDWMTGVTNTVRASGNGTIQKQFSRLPWTVRVMDALHLPFGDLRVTTRQERLQNELDAKECLQDIGIPTQDVIGRDGWTVTLEKVPGIDLGTYLVDASTEDCYDAGHRKGRELRKLHDNGYAYRDCRCANTIVGDEVYSIDHELFEQDAGGHTQMFDVLTLLGTAKCLPWSTYKQFRDGVHDGYGGNSPRPLTRTVLELPCALGYALLMEQEVRSLANVAGNWFRELADKQ